MNAANADDFRPVEKVSPFVRPHDRHNWYSYKTNILWVNEESAKLDPSIAAHEMSHFLMHVSTPYGYVLDTLNSIQVFLVEDYCKELVDIGEPIIFPILDYAKLFLQHHDSLFPSAQQPRIVEDLIAICVKPWSHLVFLERLFEGNRLPSVIEASEDDALASFSRFEELEDRIREPDDLTIDSVQDSDISRKSFASGERKWNPLGKVPGVDFKSPACPVLPFEGHESVPVGSQHVFEGDAIIYAVSSETLGNLARSAGDATDQEYYALWVWTIREYGIVDGTDSVKELRETFLALCDLALFVPAGMLYGRLRPPKTYWMDVHPGYRFMRALSVAKNLGRVTDLKRDCLGFQSAICDELGWKSPVEFLRLGASVHIPNYARHRDACRLRLTNYTIFLEPDHRDEAFRTFYFTHMPIQKVSGDSEIGLGGSSPTEKAGKVANIFLAHFCWEIMTSEKIEYLDLLPDGLQYYFSQMNSKRDVIDMYIDLLKYVHPRHYRWLGEVRKRLSQI